MHSRLKQLMKELECAIGGSLSRSSRVAEAIAKINDEGFDIFLILEATIGLSRQKKEEARAGSELVGARATSSETTLNINAQDVNFLKSLRISVDDAP